MSREKSTLEYLSNIQIIDTTISNDTKYMSFVHDPFSLEQMEKMIETGRIRYGMTQLQVKEKQTASGHCAFAFKDDYPWGTILVDDEKKVVCKCINQDCSVFSQCRRGMSAFSEDELKTDTIGILPDITHKETLISQLEKGVLFKQKLTSKTSIEVLDDDSETRSVLEEELSFDNDNKLVKSVEQNSSDAEVVEKTTERNLVDEFSKWLINDGFFENVIEKYIGNLSEYDYLLKADGKLSIFDDICVTRLDEIIREYESKLNGPKYRAAMKYYRKFVEKFVETKNKEKNEISLQEEKVEVIHSEIHTQVNTRDSKETLKEFHEWMLYNDYKKTTADGYLSAIKSANAFSKKKGIWTDDIFMLEINSDISSTINDMADQLEKSPFFKASMSYYVIALRVFAKFYADKEIGKESEVIEAQKDEVEVGSSSIIEIEVDTKEGFEKFIEAEQDNVILAKPSERIIVNAGPGTGKTYTLIEKLVAMINEETIDPEEILVLCFSRAAVEVIEKRLQSEFDEGKIGMNWHSIDIRTFDSFATHLLAYVAENEKELLYDGFSLDYLDYDGRIKAAIDVVKKSKELIEQCMHLVVDEVQDLVASRAQFVMQLIKSLPDDAGYTLLGDACQSIYDYQIQLGEIDSVKFYSWLFKNQSNSKFYSFTINHRQVSELELLGNDYRNAILTGNDKSRKDVTNRIFNKVKELEGIDLKTTEYDELLSVFGEKSVGILTRTNGQALKISTLFRNKKIPHKVQKRLTDNSLNMWIANIFRDYENDTIDKDTFSELYEEKGDMSFDADIIWAAIEKTQYESKDRYYVKDLLTGILKNSKTKEFYTSAGDEQITISNIHRSKGREFDEVVLFDDALFMGDQEKKNLMEHKVTYVAVTRAKEKLYKTSIGTQYIKTDKNGARRSYLTNLGFRKMKPYLSHIEVGHNYDLEATSFAENADLQEKFDDPLLLVGERVKLIKNMDYSQEVGYISYDIVLEDEMSFGRIGRTSKKFYLDLKRIIKDVNKLPPEKDVHPQNYPCRFSEIYIDDVVSILSKINLKAVAGKKYGDVMVWKGIAITGFAQVEKDTY
ncbi:MAG: AAA family ATPase [Lachnospiraceae bacterium]|nr:AAA family ATPase [Lachnospiraceae bacterium]